MKLPYPRNKDIEKAILHVLNSYATLSPQEFVPVVKHELARRGFFVGLVTEKRIWRLYEKLVKEGTTLDYLDVIKNKK